MSDAALVDTPPDKPEAPPPAAKADAVVTPPADVKPAEVKPADKPLAAAPTPDVKPNWPDNWRKLIAEEFSNGDAAAADKAMKTLARYTTPGAVFGSREELRRWRDEGGFAKIPKADSKPEDIAAFHKALGVPDKPEAYLDSITLENGAVVGDEDKPNLAYFAEAAHKQGIPPAAFNGIVNAYFSKLEAEATELDKRDSTTKRENEAQLKAEWGGSYEDNLRYIAAAFTEAPGGREWENPDSLLSRIHSARLPDGTIVGNDITWMRFIANVGRMLHPEASIPEGHGSVSDRLAEIRQLRRDNPDAYDRDHKLQAEEQRLIAADLQRQRRA
jgi:hypothetical protein